MNDVLLEVRDLVKHFPSQQGVFTSRLGRKVSAVDGVTLSVRRGRTLGLVGESGSGKSTVGRAIMRLLEPTSGEVWFDGVDVRALKRHELKEYRRRVQTVFQDPYGSLNPRMTVGETIAEPLKVQAIGTGDERLARVKSLLDVVGLSPEHIGRYPHEFSGGQRQRIGIARALALSPQLVVCDEPVSALDVSMQAQILNLLSRLQDMMGLTYLLIAHDLSVIRRFADDVAVMHLGKIVEMGPCVRLYHTPSHPYTQSLLSAVPVPDPRAQRARARILLAGDPPSPVDPPPGCRFHTRCPIAKLPLCATREPSLRQVSGDHVAACHFAKPFPIPVEHPGTAFPEGSSTG